MEWGFAPPPPALGRRVTAPVASKVGFSGVQTNPSTGCCSPNRFLKKAGVLKIRGSRLASF